MTLPRRTTRSPRATQIVNAARGLLENNGIEAMTMRLLAEFLEMRAPSLYKHFRNKEAIEVALIETGLTDIGTALHEAVASPEPDGAIPTLLRTYRRHALAHPNLYRLSTQGALPREQLAAGLEEWAGTPFFLAAGEPHLAQALWSFAHGMVILELDDRFPPGNLDPTWHAGATAFTTAAAAHPPPIPTTPAQTPTT
ncbi:Transcriptional regulator, TetR family [Alloactinosynnema sp. L-07]|uniref:TetR/AcrR family transcriptional regulator n=1 Tax=Alloactinosynnema sp. L-07 TaxID=1653480 RepID=UPI00065EF464|nr:TetR/AcrR family transcriptional regulator [Alloactinosynnema sp. L-07]CRK58809.1 Transcriptional regulator, TetR family [Alloactinosynnema sp. L-07]